MWFICAGENGFNTKDNHRPEEFSCSSISFCIFALLNSAYTIRMAIYKVQDRMKRYKIKNRVSQASLQNINSISDSIFRIVIQPIAEESSNRQNVTKLVNSTNLVDNFTSILFFSLICFYAILIGTMEERGFLDPQWLKTSEGKLVLYLNLMLPQFCTNIVGPVTLFLRNKTFRNVILRDFFMKDG